MKNFIRNFIMSIALCFALTSADAQCTPPPFTASMGAYDPNNIIFSQGGIEGICLDAFTLNTLYAYPQGPGYTYAWTTPQGVSNGSTHYVNGYNSSDNGTYSVTITNAQGCSSTFSTTLNFSANLQKYFS